MLENISENKYIVSKIEHKARESIITVTVNTADCQRALFSN